MEREIGNRLAAAPHVRKDDASGVGKTPANSHRLSPETVRSLKDGHEANVQSSDVLQDEASRTTSKSGVPMFGETSVGDWAIKGGWNGNDI